MSTVNAGHRQLPFWLSNSESFHVRFTCFAGFKTGICSAAPLHQPFSLLALSNNTCIADTLTDAYHRFMHLYRVRAHVHHYTGAAGSVYLVPFA
jgi:hypothetical protein